MAFIVYLLCHHRPMAEVLAAPSKDMRQRFGSEFQGMTDEDVSLDSLVATRTSLFRAVVAEMPLVHRRFLLSFECGDPEWDLRHRTVLAPAGGAAVYKLWSSREALLWADTQPLRHARTKSLQHDIGLIDRKQKRIASVAALEVDSDAALVAATQIELHRKLDAEVGPADPVDTEHFGAHVAEQHAAERHRPERRKFKKFQT